MFTARLTWLGIALLLSGCLGSEATEFPPGLEPLEDNLVEAPMGSIDDPYPEGWVLEGFDRGPYDTVHARGYMSAPVAEIWQAFRNPDVGADRRTAAEWRSEALEEEAYESFVVHSVVHDIVTVEWSTTWRLGLVAGTEAEPDAVAIRWQKTEGASILRLIEGSLVLRAAGDGSVTEIDLIYNVNALGAGLTEYELYVEDILRDALAVAKGDPLPTYE